MIFVIHSLMFARLGQIRKVQAPLDIICTFRQSIDIQIKIKGFIDLVCHGPKAEKVSTIARFEAQVLDDDAFGDFGLFRGHGFVPWFGFYNSF